MLKNRATRRTLALTIAILTVLTTAGCAADNLFYIIDGASYIAQQVATTVGAVNTVTSP